mgnify:CR=1 FL=1
MLCNKHKITQALCGSVLSAVMTATMLTTTVSADTFTVNYDSTADGSVASGYQDIPVELEKAETYTVTLPKSIVLDGSADSTTLPYTVNAVGEIGTTHFVRVIPLAGSKLYNEDGTVSLDLDVTLDKRRWTDAEVVTSSGANDTNGTMTVDSITPGTWIGKVRFYVTLDDGGSWTPATCTTPTTCIGYDTNDDGIISEDEKLAEPITKGKALGHKFAVGSIAFPDTCERCKKTVFAISTPEQLTAFRDAVNSGTTFAGATIELNDDIDMSETPWDTGIGKNYTAFDGTFDGNNHTIKNLHITRTVTSASSAVGCGFFNYLDYNTVKNVTFTDCSIDYTRDGGSGADNNVAIVAGLISHETVLQNVHVRKSNIKANNVSSSSDVYAGLLAGSITYNNSVINNCSVTDSSIYASNSVDKKGCYLAGFVGYVPQKTMQITNSLCNVTCTVGAAYYYALGNIVNKYQASDISIVNCVEDTTGTVIATDVSSSSFVKAPSYTNCLQVDTEQCKTQDAVDILNTDNTKTWVLDLENNNNGFPYIK